jgi:hypothetical protein
MKAKVKGLSLEECARRAEKYIAERGLCLIIMDVKNSGAYSSEEWPGFSDRLNAMMQDINHKFAEYLPRHDKYNSVKRIKGFVREFGDRFVGGINASEAVNLIYNYQTTKYPDVPMHWSVARDGWDDEGFSHV